MSKLPCLMLVITSQHSVPKLSLIADFSPVFQVGVNFRAYDTKRNKQCISFQGILQRILIVRILGQFWE